MTFDTVFRILASAALQAASVLPDHHLVGASNPDVLRPSGRCRGYGLGMGIQRKSAEPVGITNASGQPEIALEIDGLVISMTPPAKPAPEPTSGEDGSLDDQV